MYILATAASRLNLHFLAHPEKEEEEEEGEEEEEEEEQKVFGFQTFCVV
jgi:ribosomal protein L12E/L44/L45/RPP1/RPP2